MELNTQSEEVLKRKNIPLNRINVDNNAVNNWGRKLIDLCKNNNIVILNGRKGESSFNPTTKFKTVIDYLLADNSIFHKIMNFKIDDFDNLFSDVHCVMSCECEIIMGNENFTVGGKPKQVTTTERIKPWDPAKTELYNQNLQLENISSILFKLDKLTEINNFDDNPSVNPKQEINIIVEEINHTLIHAAIKTFGIKRQNN